MHPPETQKQSLTSANGILLNTGHNLFYRQPVSLIAALLVPFFIFWLVLILNDRDLDLENIEQRVINFDVEKKKQLEKPKPKPLEKKKNRQLNKNLPEFKPGVSGEAAALDGLSFGVPSFDESDFSEFSDQSLLDDASSASKKKQVVDTRPKVIKRSPIVYPELARKQGISGYVTMNVLINENGNVEDVKIVDAKPEEIFNLKAESTIRKWRFEPATFNGRKVQAWALQKIVFKLQ